MWLIILGLLGALILSVIFVVRLVIWIAFLIIIAALFMTCTSHASELGPVGYMQNKAGGLVVLTQRGIKGCRKPWRAAFTTNAQNQVVRQSCWRQEGSQVIMRMDRTDTASQQMAWPVRWFTFEGAAE